MRELHERCPEVCLIVLTARQEDSEIEALRRVPVEGYILKDEDTEVIVPAIRSVVAGGRWFSQAVRERFLAAPVRQPSLLDLTAREQTLLDLVAQGKDNATIAQELYLSPQTVRNYMTRIYTKLGVASRGEAIIWAQAHRASRR